MEITTTHTISDESIDNLLCGAFEGGSNYWYQINNVVTPYTGYAHEAWRTNNNGILIEDGEEEAEYEGYLNRESVKRGLELMNRNYCQHWSDFIIGNDDAETSDLFLQLCVFGEVIFG